MLSFFLQRTSLFSPQTSVLLLKDVSCLYHIQWHSKTSRKRSLDCQRSRFVSNKFSNTIKYILNQDYNLCKYLRYMYCDKFKSVLQNSALTFSRPDTNSPYPSLTMQFNDNGQMHDVFPSYSVKQTW